MPRRGNLNICRQDEGRAGEALHPVVGMDSCEPVDHRRAGHVWDTGEADTQHAIGQVGRKGVRKAPLDWCRTHG